MWFMRYFIGSQLLCQVCIIIIIITRPMPPYGRQGLAGSWGMDTVRRVHFGVFSTSQPTSFDPKNVTSQTRGPNRPFRCLDYFRAIVTPVAQFFRKKWNERTIPIANIAIAILCRPLKCANHQQLSSPKNANCRLEKDFNLNAKV